MTPLTTREIRSLLILAVVLLAVVLVLHHVLARWENENGRTDSRTYVWSDLTDALSRIIAALLIALAILSR